jgi:rod shape-determining protein MreC
MRHIPVEPPAFFHRGPSPLARLALFGVISIGLLFLDTRYRYLENIRQVAAIALYPIQRAALVPGEAIAHVGSYFASQRALAEENATLKRRLVEQAAAAQGFSLAQSENARLKSLLDLRSRHGGAGTVAEVLYSGRDPFAQRLYLDKGADAGLRPGEAVIDAEGVVGQVTRVFPFMAEVTLVTDKDHAVPVKVQRSGVRSVLYGAGAGHAPELRFLSPNADIQIGDVLVTSGIDGTYPPGLAVAQVAGRARNRADVRADHNPPCGREPQPAAAVLAQAAALPPRPEEAAGADAAKKSGKARRRGP